VALAKRKPGSLNAGAAGAGSFQHLATELFRLRAGIDIVIVQYKGGGPALVDTIAGQVQMNVGSVVQNLPHVRSGKLQGARHRRRKAHCRAAGCADFRRGGRGRRRSEQLVGHRSRPPARPRRRWRGCRQDIAAILDAPETRKRFELEGAEVMRMSPAQFGDSDRSETDKWTRVVKQAGIKAE
jgi:tripartite-type tricarboxylate transporter receptor subunit TctC